MTDVMSGDGDQGQDFDAEFEGAREAEYEAPEQHQGAEANDGDDTEQPQAKKDDLGLDEVKKRWDNQKVATRQEREKRRDLERQLAELKAWREQQERKPAAKDDGPPDPIVDPVGAIQWQQEQWRSQQEARQREEQEARTREVSQREVHEIRDWGVEQESDFRDEHADYDDAATHFAQARIQELADIGMPNPQSAFLNELLELTRTAKSTGKNPAEMIYKLAANRGFGKKSAVANLDRVRSGQEQARSLSSGGGRPNSGGSPTYESVNKLKGAAWEQGFAALRAVSKKQGY